VTAGAVRGALAELRAAGEALRRRPRREVLDVLADVLDGWNDPQSPWRLELEARLPEATGFHPETVAAGIAHGLADWTGGALRALFRRELGDPASDEIQPGPLATGFPTTSVLLAGSIPMPTIVSVLAPLLVRSPVLVKSASRDPVTADLVARSIAERDAELGRCVRVVSFPGDDDDAMSAFLEADCIAATGSDETVAAVRARVRSPRRVVAYGHRVSVVALGPDACDGRALGDTADRLALDVALWDQLGCLSPIGVWVSGRDAAGRVAEALAEALAAIEKALPRGAVDGDAAARIVHERAEAEMRAASDDRVALHASEGTAWTVVREADASLRPGPLHRFVRVHPLATGATTELREALGPLGPHLAAVAVDGFGSRTASLARELAIAGASRICRPGRMQSPPLSWHHDGRAVLTPFARLTDVEVAI
jgi:hypothetical protein